VRNNRSRSSNIIHFVTNRKRVCDFLLVINGNLSPILPRFRDIAGFLWRTSTSHLFHPKFGDVSLELDCRWWGPRRPKAHSSNYFRTDQHDHGTSTSQTDGQTDGRLTMAIPCFAQRASRVKRYGILFMEHNFHGTSMTTLLLLSYATNPDSVKRLVVRDWFKTY